MNHAYALLAIKSIDAATRRITGVATTPTPDRQGDSIDPLGVAFTNPLPLLWHHDQKQPIGTVEFDPPTAAGITFTASLPIITTPGKAKDRVDEAWDSLTSTPPLIRGTSIGWMPMAAPTQLAKGVLRWSKTIIGELSLVTVPANMDATILTVKSLDAEHLAASGLHSPRVTGLPVVTAGKAAKAMTVTEQISQFENTRAAKAAARDALMTKAAETGSTLDAAQSEQYDGLDLEIKSVDAHLGRLRELEKSNLSAATRIEPISETERAAALRGGAVPVIQVKSALPKGTAFTRMCIALARGKGDSYQTLQIAKSWKDSTPEVEQMIEHMWHTKAAVAAGTTTDATWAGPLVVTQPLNEFLELLRPRTLIGAIPGMRQVPFNISVPSQTAGGTYGWVGQGLAKPVTKAAYATVTLPFSKAAGIIVLTEELARLSTPSAEALVREEMIAGMAQFLDLQFQDPAVAVAANVSPASITNGAATAAASGVTSAAAKLDLAGRVAVFAAANIPLAGSVWLMSDSNAFGLAMSVNALGQPLFPGMSITGGSIFGIPVVVSNSLSTRIVLMHAPSVLFADDGGVSIDVSREASVQMDSAPDSPATATTVLVSLWQNNLIGLRAERWITWKLARAAAVTYLTGAAYVGT